MKKYFKCLTKMQLISFLLLFLTAFLFNYWTPYAADDYSYMYNLGNGERITSVFQIFPSLAVHYMQYCITLFCNAVSYGTKNHF